MIPLLRPLFERWLLEAAQAPMAAWKLKSLAWALQRDAKLRRLALELADFEHGSAPQGDALPDLRPRLHAILQSDAQALDQPLLPSGWLPAGALASMLLVALLVSVFDGQVGRPRGTQEAKAEAGAELKGLELPSPTPTPAPIVNPTALP